SPAPPPAAKSITVLHDRLCMPGLGDANGTLGLESSSGDTMSTASDQGLHIVAEASGGEKTFVNLGGEHDARDVFLPQPDGFFVVHFIPSASALVNNYSIAPDGTRTRGPDMQGTPS